MFVSKLTLVIYASPLLVIFLLYAGAKLRKHRKSLAEQKASIEAGLTEPSSMWPVINHNRCIGCGSCAAACPEQRAHAVLGIINGKSHLVGPAYCIGHGACAVVCPRNAITLVYGTRNRGVDIPKIDENLESNVQGLFIAGELGGMGLIHRALEKGVAAMRTISNLDGIGQGDRYDVAIVGAGPAGFSATLFAKEHGLKYVTIEQEDGIGGAVYKYPKGKIVMTRPSYLPGIGESKFVETTKEELLEYWNSAREKTGIQINFRESVEKITPLQDEFEVKTNRETYRTRAVLLAIGRAGTPRKLNVCGEDDGKVVYRLIDPDDHRGKHVLVVGGGDSALEAATSIAAVSGTTVTLSYRSDAFGRAKEKNRIKVEEAEKAGRLKVLLSSNVKGITPPHVTIEKGGETMEIQNEVIIVCAGGILPTGFLKEIGITIETKYGTP
ncbi:MAG: NAD(P)-binding domain-containing protein [Proteobacteria bacterium]|nr:NAD(P)-binding domain-containing protein [Pseudomonadota bacterium]MBU1737232.1 NAD(P)-binding domain-containing protein [Pseudomonadota bacterium]